jgi:hypothetical protein
LRAASCINQSDNEHPNHFRTAASCSPRFPQSPNQPGETSVPPIEKTDFSLLRKTGYSLIVILLIIKVVGVILRGPSPMVFDAGYYWELGGLVADGDWLLMQRPIAFRTPGYPWLVGGVRTVFPSPLFALVCMQGALWIATIGLTAVMAVDLSRDRRTAWLVLVPAIFMISSVTYVSAILTETLFVFALVLHFWSVARFTRSPSLVGGVVVGATLGLAVLTRPVAMLVWVADAIYLLTRWYGTDDEGKSDQTATSHPARGRPVCIAVAALTTVLCVSPWLARNHAMFGKAMLTEFVGRNVWIVTFQDGSGAGLEMPPSDNAITLQTQLGEAVWREMLANQTWRDTWTMSKALTGSGLDDPSADRLMKGVSIDAITRAPAPFAKKTLRRFFNFWRTRATELPAQVADLEHLDGPPRNRLSEDLFAGEPIWGVTVPPVDTALRYRWSNRLTGNTFLMLATAAATMLLIWRRPTRPEGLWLATILCYFSAITALLEIPGYRYRMIIEPVILLVMALAIGPTLLSNHDPPEAMKQE